MELECREVWSRKGVILRRGNVGVYYDDYGKRRWRDLLAIAVLLYFIVAVVDSCRVLQGSGLCTYLL